MQFSQLGLIPPIAQAVAAQGYQVPTPIQARAIPHVLAGRDLLGLAQTGTGKTAAFALPILQRLAHISGGKGHRHIRCLVLTPTRELAAQILEDLNSIAVHTPLSAAAVFGGVAMGPQEHAFRSGADVIGQAQTGTGKTAAFGLPLLESVTRPKTTCRRSCSHRRASSASR